MPWRCGTLVTVALLGSCGPFAAGCGEGGGGTTYVVAPAAGKGLALGPPTGATTESGGQVTFTVALSAAPSGTATVMVTALDDTEVQVSPASLTFNETNWANPRTVTVRGVDDDAADGDQTVEVTLSTGTSADAEFAARPDVSIAVVNLDDDQAAVNVAASGGATSEGGGQVTLTVSLSAAPRSDVVLALSSSDASEATLSTSSLTFAAGTTGPLSVVVTGEDDGQADGNQTFSIVLTASSGDAAYAGLPPVTLTLTNLGEAAGIVLAPLGDSTTREGGASVSFVVFLQAAPTAAVDVPVSTSDPAEGTTAVSTLTFTPSDWNVGQVFLVTTQDDSVVDGNVSYSLQLGPATSSDVEYDGRTALAALTNEDDDGFLVGPVSGPTTESGGQATFTLELAVAPTSDVVITLASDDPTEGDPTPTTITFTPLDWNAPRTITVTGVVDALADGPQGYFIVFSPATSGDPRFDAARPDDVALTNQEGPTWDFDSGLQGWTVTATSATVTWDADGAPSPVAGQEAASVSGPNSLNYNDDVDFYDGARNSGQATSPAMDLSPFASPELSFECNHETEGGSSFDQRRVQVSSDDFATTLLNVLLDGNSCGAMGTWHSHTFALDPAWGTVRLRFSFDTIDSVSNGFDGWFVDDVSMRE